MAATIKVSLLPAWPQSGATRSCTCLTTASARHLNATRAVQPALLSVTGGGVENIRGRSLVVPLALVVPNKVQNTNSLIGKPQRQRYPRLRSGCIFTVLLEIQRENKLHILP